MLTDLVSCFHAECPKGHPYYIGDVSSTHLCSHANIAVDVPRHKGLAYMRIVYMLSKKEFLVFIVVGAITLKSCFDVKSAAMPGVLSACNQSNNFYIFSRHRNVN